MRPSPLWFVTSLVAIGCNPDSGLTLHDNNRPPVVTIVAPSGGERFIEGESVEFAARVEDDATALPDLELSWRTTNGGALTGDPTVTDDTITLVATGLASGDHTVSLTALDAQAASGRAEVAIVVEDNGPPAVAFEDPVPDGRYALGAAVPVLVAVDDDWDPPEGLGLSWGDAASGVGSVPGTPDDTGQAAFTLTGLPLGSHRVTVTATDAQGSTRTLSVDFDVVDPDGDADGHAALDLGGDDCDDLIGSTHPGADEVCDGDDNNCDGFVDEDATDAPTWFFDDDLDGYGDPGVEKVACTAPGAKWKVQAGDCDDADNARFPGNPEVCDGRDNDCAAGVDDGLSFATYYTDGDGDTWGLVGSGTSACAQPADTVTRGGDCNDATDTVNPGKSEVCNGVDDDCTGGIDNGLTFATYYTDGDGDTWGLVGSGVSACAQPADTATRGGDCNDATDTVNPGKSEVCNGVDDDCTAGIDNGLTFTTYYPDTDHDTWGTGSGTSACAQPSNTATRGGDCADNNDQVNPGKTEVCNGVDDDCAAGIDNGLTFATWYRDSDLDGFGNPNVSQSRCDTPASPWIDAAGDCDDDDELVNPLATEVCNNGVDDDCTNGIDDSCAVDYSGTWWLYVPGTNMRKTVTYGCDGWTFSFDTVTIDDTWPTIEVTAGALSTRVNGCEPGWPCGDTDGMTGDYDSSTAWTASDSVDPFFGFGYAEIYEWLDSSGTSGTDAQFTNATTFVGSFAWHFLPVNGTVPAGCTTGHVAVEGRKQ